jgi:hypothetical protein
MRIASASARVGRRGTEQIEDVGRGRLLCLASGPLPPGAGRGEQPQDVVVAGPGVLIGFVAAGAAPKSPSTSASRAVTRVSTAATGALQVRPPSAPGAASNMPSRGRASSAIKATAGASGAVARTEHQEELVRGRAGLR